MKRFVTLFCLLCIMLMLPGCRNTGFATNAIVSPDKIEENAGSKYIRTARIQNKKLGIL